MKIIDLTPEYEKLYFCCLEDWSEEMKEAGDHKACWYNKMKDKGLRVKLALDDHGTVGGMIQYAPSGISFIEGQSLYVVLCIWVHGYNKGPGNFQKKGFGKTLLKTAEEDAQSLGAKGLAAWGIALPFFMRASWFKKQGYHVADKDGLLRLLWKPFSDEAIPPRFIKQKKKPGKTPGKVNISVFINGWCPAQSIVYERTKRAVQGFENQVDFREYWTTDKEIQKEWGISDALYIDGRKIRTGPPPTYARIRKLIEKKATKIKAGRS